MSLYDALITPATGGTPTPAASPLDLFDAARGVTHLEPGTYTARITCGMRVKTKSTNKDAYRLDLVVAEGDAAGHRLQRTLTLDTPAAANVAKAMLAPLGITTGAALNRPYPPPGQDVTVRVLVGVQTRQDGTLGNDVLRIEVVDVTTAPPNPNLVDTTAYPAPAPPAEGGAA
jgi:hypothetical protein